MRNLSTCLLIVLLCATDFALAQTNADETAVRQVLDRAYDAVNRGDADAFFRLLAPGATSFAWDGSRLSEWQSADGLREGFAAGMAFDIAPAERTVRVFGDTAVATEYYSGTFTSSSGEVTPLNIRATAVLVRQDGQWVVAHFHQSPRVSSTGE